MVINSVAVIGAGQMGYIVSWLCAANGGLETYLYDISEEQLQKTLKRLEESFAERLSKEESRAALAKIRSCDTLSQALSQADLSFENVPEDIELKKRVHAEIGRLASPHTLMGSNASSLLCSPFAEASGRPEKFFNMNFAVIDPQGEALVEIMWNPKTSGATKTAAIAWARKMNVVPLITKKEIMGYTFNRTWRAIKKEVLYLADQGYADPQDIDRAWMLLFGTPQGPFGMMDQIGLDSIQRVEMQYHRDSGDPRDAPPKILNALVEAGHLGEKTGHGFYRWPNPDFTKPGWLTKEPPWDSNSID
jgi:3-hydroxybutyryl-CoA dehydrogenase